MKNPILPLLVTLAMACVTTLFAQDPPKPAKPVPPAQKSVNPEAHGKKVLANKDGAIDANNDVSASLRLEKTQLELVLNIYSELTGRSIIRTANLPKVVFDLNPAGPISKEEAAALITDLLAGNELLIVHAGDNTAKVIPSAVASRESVPFSSADDLPNSDLYVAVKIKTQHVDPSKLIDMLNSFSRNGRGSVIAVDGSRTLILRDCARNVKRMLEMVRESDVPDTLIHLTEVIPLKKTKAAEIATALSELTDKPRVYFSPPEIPAPKLDKDKSQAASPLNALEHVTTGSSRSSSSRPSSSSSRGSSYMSSRSGSLVSRPSPKTPLGNTSIVPLYGSNSILVVAPTKEKMDLVKKIVGLIEAGTK